MMGRTLECPLISPAELPVSIANTWPNLPDGQPQLWTAVRIKKPLSAVSHSNDSFTFTIPSKVIPRNRLRSFRGRANYVVAQWRERGVVSQFSRDDLHFVLKNLVFSNDIPNTDWPCNGLARLKNADENTYRFR